MRDQEGVCNTPLQETGMRRDSIYHLDRARPNPPTPFPAREGGEEGEGGEGGEMVFEVNPVELILCWIGDC